MLHLQYEMSTRITTIEIYIIKSLTRVQSRSARFMLLKILFVYFQKNRMNVLKIEITKILFYNIFFVHSLLGSGWFPVISLSQYSWVIHVADVPIWSQLSFLKLLFIQHLYNFFFCISVYHYLSSVVFFRQQWFIFISKDKYLNIWIWWNKLVAIICD